MKKETRVGVSILLGLALAIVVWTLAPVTGSAQAAVTTLSAQDAQTPAAAPQSVSGKIASVEKSSFTLTVAEKPSVSSSGGPKTMSFQVDQNTTIDGKLKVGANADVTYRQEGGNNIAISVRVS